MKTFGEIAFSVKATLDTEGKGSLKVTAAQPYGPDGRTATATEEVTDKKLLGEIEKVLKSATVGDIRDQLSDKVQTEAAESYALAARRGEYTKKK